MQSADASLKRKFNFLLYYTIISSSLFLFFMLSSFNEKDKTLKLDEITVKKMSLIGEDGSLRMVISNETRQHPGRMKGIDLPKRERPSGIIFFNNQGDECGGIIAKVTPEKNATNSGMSFTMDNYHDDQVIQILNDETYENGKAEIQRGLFINEFPLGTDVISRVAKFEEIEKIKDPKEKKEKMDELREKEGSKRRLFVGRKSNNDTGIFLYDSKGKPKMKIYVDKDGSAKIEVIDAEGKAKNIVQ
ncbi:hypothetical protein HHL16_14070 [Pseudoflavitalea sp. G-6-1-2]|uniref:hypothetical protein n=1 Tax=Pseudoflavitalea sp. G-6-1-2 TaxID=2728841 RepID=UPI00146E651D|nr:hypothetical protein [Pseudoflavitalea sp. G-6-1-2]NML22011.1 hypothetical protein [Pseudoflavitalea sp. G-6-1-2]